MKRYNKFLATKPSFLDNTLAEYDEGNVATYGPYFLYKRKEVFSEASLVLTQRELGKKMEWVTWVTIPAESFISVFNSSSKEDVFIRGKLFYPLAFYEELGILEVDIHFHQIEGTRPTILILENSGNLYNEFKNGVTKETYLEWQRKLNPS